MLRLRLSTLSLSKGESKDTPPLGPLSARAAHGKKHNIRYVAFLIR